MLFRMGSTTKMFVAAALVGLAEEGKLKLDAPVGAAVKGLPPKVAALTPHQLLTHTAGLREEVVWNGPHDDSALGANIRAWTDDRVVREPGKQFAYCNPGYWLAGLAVEEAGGGPFAAVMRDRLFAPLGMTRTTFRPTWAMTYPLAVGHDRDKDGKPFVVRPLADNAANWPAGSMFSSVEELSRWMVAFLNGGKLEGRQVIPSAVVEKLGTPHVDVGKGGVKYGYGLRVREWRGVRVLEHSGSRSGYGSTMMLVPAERVGVVVLANRSGSGLRPVAEKALELLVPERP
jgi:CubicO group peptidase (beta-lactamase class C family)